MSNHELCGLTDGGVGSGFRCLSSPPFFFGFDDDEMVHPNEITAVLGLGRVQIVQYIGCLVRRYCPEYGVLHR